MLHSCYSDVFNSTLPFSFSFISLNFSSAVVKLVTQTGRRSSREGSGANENTLTGTNCCFSLPRVAEQVAGEAVP